MPYKELRKIKSKAAIGNLTAELIGEQFDGLPVLDTEVRIGGEILCCISGPEKEKFLTEINDVISKYRI